MRSGDDLRAVCTIVRDTMFEAHRGAIPSEGGRAVLVFGNDGYSTPKTQRAIQIVRARLARDGYRLGDPVADAQGYTWVMEADVPDRTTGYLTAANTLYLIEQIDVA